MTEESVEQRFVARTRQLLVALPFDLKVLYEAMSDENLPGPARLVAAQAVIYCLSPSDPIPDSAGLLGFVDDALLLRLALKRIVELGGEDAEPYTTRFVEQYAEVDQDLELVRGYLGQDMAWLEQRLQPKYATSRFKGKDANTCIEDDEAMEFLYNEGQAFATDYEIDEEEAAKLRSGEAVVEVFHKRALVESNRA